MNPWLLSIPLAYLLGSIPFGYLLVRAFRKQDVRASGSGNIGATNVTRSGGKALGIATLMLDLGKGLAAVLLAYVIAWRTLPPAVAHYQAASVANAAAIAAVLGHVFPVWLGFRGGKGVATALGVFMAMSPRTSLCALAVFIVVFALTRFVSLASIAAAALLPCFAFYFVRHPSPVTIAAFLFIPALVIAKHHANIRRLLAGTESRFGSANRVSG